MAKLKQHFRNKDEITAYEGLVITWPVADAVSFRLYSMLPAEKQNLMLPVIQSAIAAYNQPYPFYMTDWERFAVYLIVTINFVAQVLNGEVTFDGILSSCSLPKKMTSLFIEDTAKKLCMERVYA